MVNDKKIIHESLIKFIEENNKLGYIKANDLYSFIEKPMIHEVFLKHLDERSFRFFKEYDGDMFTFWIGKADWDDEQIKQRGLLLVTTSENYGFYQRMIELLNTAQL